MNYEGSNMEMEKQESVSAADRKQRMQTLKESETGNLNTTCASASCCGGVHPRILENLNELTTKRRDVLLDLVDIIFCDPFTLCFALFNSYVPPDQIPHDTLPTQA
jgi:hypothetical protein